MLLNSSGFDICVWQFSGETLLWHKLTTSGEQAPSPRCAHGGGVDEVHDQLFILGGQTKPEPEDGEMRDDAFVLDLSPLLENSEFRGCGFSANDTLKPHPEDVELMWRKIQIQTGKPLPQYGIEAVIHDKHAFLTGIHSEDTELHIVGQLALFEETNGLLKGEWQPCEDSNCPLGTYHGNLVLGRRDMLKQPNRPSSLLSNSSGSLNRTLMLDSTSNACLPWKNLTVLLHSGGSEPVRRSKEVEKMQCYVVYDEVTTLSTSSGGEVQFLHGEWENVETSGEALMRVSPAATVVDDSLIVFGGFRVSKHDESDSRLRLINRNLYLFTGEQEDLEPVWYSVSQKPFGWSRPTWRFGHSLQVLNFFTREPYLVLYGGSFLNADNEVQISGGTWISDVSTGFRVWKYEGDTRVVWERNESTNHLGAGALVGIFLGGPLFCSIIITCLRKKCDDGTPNNRDVPDNRNVGVNTIPPVARDPNSPTIPWATESTCEVGAFAGDSCIICFSDYEEGERLAKLVCGHSYHEDCIRMWFQNSHPRRCPLCQTRCDVQNISELMRLISG